MCDPVLLTYYEVNKKSTFLGELVLVFLKTIPLHPKR